MDIPPAVWLSDWVNSAPMISHTGDFCWKKEKGNNFREQNQMTESVYNNNILNKTNVPVTNDNLSITTLQGTKW